MPNFTARPTSGTTLVTWTDPAATVGYCTGLAPSRLNPDPAHAHKYYRTDSYITVTMKATVGGAEGPADGALGGDTFQCWFARWPGAAPPLVTLTPGFSSIASFTPIDIGHYVFVFFRIDGGSGGGGAVAIPFEVIFIV